MKTSRIEESFKLLKNKKNVKQTIEKMLVLIGINYLITY